MPLLFGLFGLIVGSFINVAVTRHGVKTLGGRSVCMSCDTRLAWYDNIPVLSWFILGGRCRTCGTRISPQYPAVELSTAALFALIGALEAPLALQVLYACIASLFLAIALYDLRHTIIPDAWVFLLMAISLVASLLTLLPEGSLVSLLLGGPVAALPLAVLWAVSRGAWMGFGDVKLALAIGWLLGPYYGFLAVWAAFIVGAAVALLILLPIRHIASYARKRGIARLRSESTSFTMKSEVPFGPFLIVSTLAIWLLLLFRVPLPI